MLLNLCNRRIIMLSITLDNDKAENNNRYRILYSTSLNKRSIAYLDCHSSEANFVCSNEQETGFTNNKKKIKKKEQINKWILNNIKFAICNDRSISEGLVIYHACIYSFVESHFFFMPEKQSFHRYYPKRSFLSLWKQFSSICDCFRKTSQSILDINYRIL